MSGEHERWLPTVERAKTLGPIVVQRGWFRGDLNLWDMRIARVEALAGISMRGRILRRDAWEADEEVSQARWQQLIAPPPGDPRTFTPVKYVRARDPSGGPAKCSYCVVGNPGTMACPMCNGTGVRSSSNGEELLMVRCAACREGLVACTHCDGTAFTIRARIEYVDQRVEAWASLVLPDVPPRVSKWLHEMVTPSTVLAEELRFPLDRMLDVGPYRGASVPREPEFRGYRFQGAFDRAREALQQITGRADVLASEYQSYAAPILWVCFDDGPKSFDAAFIVDANAAIRGYAAVR